MDGTMTRLLDTPDTTAIAGLRPLAPVLLPFARDLAVRAFVLEREQGNLLVYSTPGLVLREGVARQYLGHGHEAGVGTPATIDAPLFVHEADRALVEPVRHVRGTFSRRHTLDDDFEVIPIPGHTPGSTAYLWDTGEQRLLFTADTIVLRDGEWRTAVLDSSDPAAYARSLELIRGLDFDVLVPWAASRDQSPYALTTAAETRRRIDALLERVRR
jgi:Metallo-beta-lactamase superfamily